MNAIADYRPSPSEAAAALTCAASEAGISCHCDTATLSAAVLTHDTATACLRVLSGTLTSDISVLNSRTGKNISLPVSEAVFSGDILIMTVPGHEGFSNPDSQVFSSCLPIQPDDLLKFGVGDIICDARHPVTFKMPAILPEPVFAATLPFADKKAYDEISGELKHLQLNVPSLRIFENLSVGTVTAAADYKNFDQLQELCLRHGIQPEIFYRERLKQKYTCICEYNSRSNGKYDRIILEFIPMENGYGITISNSARSLPPEFIRAVENGISDAAMQVQIPENYPLTALHVNILETPDEFGSAAWEALQTAVSDGLKNAVENSGTIRLEPVAKAEIQINEQFFAGFMQMLAECRGIASEVENIDTVSRITAEIPFACIHEFLRRSQPMSHGIPMITVLTFSPVTE